MATVTAMLGSFPRREQDDLSSEAKLLGYQIAVEDFPAWAVIEACKRYIKGTRGDRRFAPTPPELAAACQHLVDQACGRAIYYRRLAATQVEREVSEEERAATLSRLATIMSPLTASENIATEEPPANA